MLTMHTVHRLREYLHLNDLTLWPWKWTFKWYVFIHLRKM